MIEDADRSGAKVFIQIAGMSSSGKTLSALRLARGMVGNNGKIGVIDTEQKRASIYHDKVGGFKVINLEPPFTPERYEQAVKAFKDAGYDCVVIDSMSHEWEGVGGVCEMAAKSTVKGIGAWKVPKEKHKKMMDYLMRCGMHIVGCYRAKIPMEEQTINGKKVMVHGDMQICAEQKNIYDITVSLIMDEDTKFPRINKKCPEDIEFMFMKNDYINEQDGETMIEWLSTPCQNKTELKASFAKSGLSAQDWFKTLNKFEKYIARKHKSEIIGE